MPPAGFLGLAHFLQEPVLLHSLAVSPVLGLLSVDEASKLTLPSVKDSCHVVVGGMGTPSASFFYPSLNLAQSLAPPLSSSPTDVR